MVLVIQDVASDQISNAWAAILTIDALFFPLLKKNWQLFAYVY